MTVSQRKIPQMVKTDLVNKVGFLVDVVLVIAYAMVLYSV